ncbi:MAG: hypothetical protein BroJett003_12450 [Planctomycetota bacterium]|nr:MAG: hypothetical protein BroJett003_12450 [Planctomycetota bacterium]
MIEFKSPCGHTVRARDEDAGRDVKCNYCGKEVRVPSDRADDLDFLMSEVSATSAVASPPRKARGGGPFSGGRRSAESGPREVILKLTYAAAAITAVVIVTRNYVLPALAPGEAPEEASGMHQPSPEPRPRRVTFGLTDLSGEGGLYVSAVPPGAEVYLVDQKTWTMGQRIVTAPGSKRMASGETFCGTEGVFIVEAALPWNDKSLKAYPDYNSTFRRALESAEKGEASNALARQYFLPDGATSVFVTKETDQTYVVRQYKVELRKDGWESVTAFFVPASLKVGDLVTRYLPSEPRFGFDEEHVRGELEYYGVPLHDRTYVMDALARIGAVPYDTSGGSVGAEPRVVRMFRIDVGTGQFRTQVLSGAGSAGGN